jgi:hypothetical protein
MAKAYPDREPGDEEPVKGTKSVKTLGEPAKPLKTLKRGELF